jgi:hypothetical protein
VNWRCREGDALVLRPIAEVVRRDENEPARLRDATEFAQRRVVLVRVDVLDGRDAHHHVQLEGDQWRIPRFKKLVVVRM